ncbi:ThuA domain-containing protein [bacterium]|nr:ThuA domain-containing protein [bacterium]
MQAMRKKSICRFALFAFSVALTLSASAQDGPVLVGKKALFLIGEREYRTAETLPAFAKEHLEPLGIDSTFIIAGSDDRTSSRCHLFEGIAELDSADILVLSLRRRFPRAEDLALIREWIESGKPVIAIRTACHAFGERKNGDGYEAPEGHRAWNTFCAEVLGAEYQGHYQPQDQAPLSAWVEDKSLSHPIVQNLSDTRFDIGEKLYKFDQLDPEIEVLVSARFSKDEPTMPVAWTNTIEGKRVFYTSLGTPEEMENHEIQSILKNAFIWALSPEKGNGQIE